MELTLKRKELVGATPGEIHNEKGELLALTLEDQVRPFGEFVYGVTAIPYGKYRLVVTYSNRFKKPMVLVLCDRNTTIMFGSHSIDSAGIRIHGGNKTEDTLGCILCGENRNTNGYDIFNCAPAVNRIFDLVNAHFLTETVYLNIVKVEDK